MTPLESVLERSDNFYKYIIPREESGQALGDD